MSFEEACEATVTRDEAAREIRAHGVDPREFFDEAGEHPTYSGTVVLAWLGY